LVSDRQEFSFHCWTKTFNAEKNDESSFTFLLLFSVRQEKQFYIFFHFYFSGQEKFLKQNFWIFLRLLRERQKDFFKFKTVDKTENADNSGFAAIAG
jgi:hypothetical protein